MQVKVCPKCKNLNEEPDEVCIHCGTSLAGVEPRLRRGREDEPEWETGPSSDPAFRRRGCGPNVWVPLVVLAILGAQIYYSYSTKRADPEPPNPRPQAMGLLDQFDWAIDHNKFEVLRIFVTKDTLAWADVDDESRKLFFDTLKPMLYPDGNDENPAVRFQVGGIRHTAPNTVVVRFIARDDLPEGSGDLTPFEWTLVLDRRVWQLDLPRPAVAPAKEE